MATPWPRVLRAVSPPRVAPSPRTCRALLPPPPRPCRGEMRVPPEPPTPARARPGRLRLLSPPPHRHVPPARTRLHGRVRRRRCPP
eukprot:1331622-Pleurochrysis_carterae.AAC.1